MEKKHPLYGFIQVVVHQKNIPFSYFKNKAEDWLQKDNRNRVSFSFGPADEKLFESFQKTSLKHSENVMQIFPDSIDEFRTLLCRGVSHFLGNDSDQAT